MNLKMILEKNRERGIDVFRCFIDYSKAFVTVAHEILWYWNINWEAQLDYKLEYKSHDEEHGLSCPYHPPLKSII